MMNILFLQNIIGEATNMLHNTTTNTTIYNTTKNETHTRTQDHDIIFKELQLTLFILVLVTGAILNTAFILIYMTRRRDGTRYNLFFNLAVSNWIACAFILSRQIVALFLAPSKGIQVPCHTLLAIDEVWWVTQNWTLVAISFNRYKNVSNPYGYSQRSYRFIVMIWILAISTVLVLLFWSSAITFDYDNRINRCRKLWEFHVPYMFVYTFVAFLIPGFLLIYFYTYMMYKSYRAKRNELRPFGTGSALHRSPSIGSLVSLRDFINSIHTRRPISSNGSLPTTFDVGGSEVDKNVNLSARSSNSEGSDISGKLLLRKKSIVNSKFKPFVSTLLILVPYLCACTTNVILIYLYSDPMFVSNQKTDLLHKVKYILVAYFPYVFGWRDKEIKKELRKLHQRLKCWKSSEIGPSPNIDSNDYPENVIRRDSRRSSMVSRRSSMLVSDEPHSSTQSPYNGRDKNNTCKLAGPIANSQRDPTEIFYISSAINMPAVNC